MNSTKHNAPNGQFHPRAVLTDQQVERIRYLHEEIGLGYRKLSKLFEVSRTQIARICRYEQR
jgi:hypothetical protein